MGRIFSGVRPSNTLYRSGLGRKERQFSESKINFFHFNLLNFLELDFSLMISTINVAISGKISEQGSSECNLILDEICHFEPKIDQYGAFRNINVTKVKGIRI